MLGFSGGQSIQWVNPGNGQMLLDHLQTAGISLIHTPWKKCWPYGTGHLDAGPQGRPEPANNNKVEFSYLAEDEKASVLSKHTRSILSSVGAVGLKRVQEAPAGMPTLVTDFGTLYLDLASGIDVNAERARLKKELAALEPIISSIEKKTEQSCLHRKSPPAVVDGARKQLADNQTKHQEMIEALTALGD